MDDINGLLLAIPALPLLAAIVVACLGPKILRGASHLVVIAAIGLAFVASVMLFFQIRSAQIMSVEQTGYGFERIVTLWSWLAVDQAAGGLDLRIDVALRADPLTSMMLMMVTFVSFFVALFASGYMCGDRGYWRFFAYFGLFVFSMCMLVSVSSFLLLFVFWEGVGLCSYLLIGFWYERPSAAAAGMKAFLVNRVGDFGFTLAVFLIWIHYGTLSFHDSAWERSPDAAAATVTTDPMRVAQLAASPATDSVEVIDGVLGRRRIADNRWVTGGAGLAIALLLMLGACGKSAQFPLHVWLPDAMEGPTPVSALIHAATMVTAGVYLVARCTPLFLVSPTAQLCVAGIGGFTALLAALIALTQFDLKRVLAYSTISQLGYMFLALGTGTLAGISAGMFHLLTHAFFKALLFLGAGSVMHAMGNIIDMRRFGGLRRLMPYTYWTFLLGALALAGIFPLSGFWSKDGILAAVHDKVHWLEEAEAGHESSGHPTATGATEGPAGGALLPTLDDATRQRHARAYYWLYVVGVLTAWLTAIYTFRAVFLTFFGEFHIPGEAAGHAHESPPVMVVPLVVLAVAACVSGILLDRSYLDGVHPFAAWIGATPSLSLPALEGTPQPGTFHGQVAATSMLVALAGIGVAAFFYLGDRREVRLARRFFDFEWLLGWFDVATVARFRRWPWVAAADRLMRRVGLGWLASGCGYALLVVVLLVSAPLVIFRFVTPYALSQNRFYLDEIYDWLVVRPARALSRLCAILDRVVIDGLVDLVGWLPRAVGRPWRLMQTGLLSSYLWATALAVAVILWLSIVKGT